MLRKRYELFSDVETVRSHLTQLPQFRESNECFQRLAEKLTLHRAMAVGQKNPPEMNPDENAALIPVQALR